MSERDAMWSPPSFTHRGAFYSSTSDIVNQVVDLTRQAWARGLHMIALLDADVRDASASRLGSSAADVDFRPQAWLATRSAPAIIETCLRRTTDLPGYEPLAMVTQSPWTRRESDTNFWHRSERQIADDLADRPVDLVCMFDARASTAEHLQMARVSHPVLIVDGVDCPNPDFRPYEELFAPYHLAAHDLGPPDAVTGFGPFATAAVKLWLRTEAVEAGLSGDLVDDLTLVVNEAVTTSWETGQDHTVTHADLADHWPHLPLTRVQLWRTAEAVTCDIYTGTPLPSMSPLSPPEDQRLRMLWFAEKVSPQITVSVHDAPPNGTGSRIRIRADLS